MQKQNIILAVKGPEVPEQLMNDLISLVQAKGYEIEFAGVHREHGKMDCAIGTVEQLDGVPVPTVAAPGQSADPKLIEMLDLQTRQLSMLMKGETFTHAKLDELLKRTEQPAEAPKTRRKSAVEKKEGGAAGDVAGGQQQQPAENLSLDGQTQEGGEGEKDSQESAPVEKQAEDSAGDEGQESQTGDPQQEESAA